MFNIFFKRKQEYCIWNYCRKRKYIVEKKKLKYFKEDILFKVNLEEREMFTNWEND